MGTEYPSPVDRLLTVGDPRRFTEWPNYFEFGLTKESIPDLIRMATDMELHKADGESTEVWAPLHAWRALGQLRAESAVEPLMTLLHMDDDWIADELPMVFGMIGRSAIPVLTEYLADASHGLYPRIRASSSLGKIGSNNHEVRSECVAVLIRQLEHFSENDPALNGFLINDLMDLEGQEAISVIRKAFEADSVDSFVTGDLEDVEIAIGLRQQRSAPKPRYRPFFRNMPARLNEAIPVDKTEPKPQKPKIGRNDPCPCGSGKKYKKCCLGKE